MVLPLIPVGGRRNSAYLAGGPAGARVSQTRVPQRGPQSSARGAGLSRPAVRWGAPVGSARQVRPVAGPFSAGPVARSEEGEGPEGVPLLGSRLEESSSAGRPLPKGPPAQRPRSRSFTARSPRGCTDAHPVLAGLEVGGDPAAGESTAESVAAALRSPPCGVRSSPRCCGSAARGSAACGELQRFRLLAARV